MYILVMDTYANVFSFVVKSLCLWPLVSMSSLILFSYGKLLFSVYSFLSNFLQLMYRSY